MPLGGAVIGAVGSIAGGLIGGSAASRAAKAAAAKDNAAGQSIDKATAGAVSSGYAGITQANDALNTNTAKANGTLSDVYNNLNGTIAPYLQAGQQGINSLSTALAPGGALGTKFSFNPGDLENDPGYQFQLQQGMKAINNSAAARGLLGSGSTLKAATNYGQGLAGTSYQNAYGRALQSYQTNFQNTLGGLSTLANFGQNANQQAIGIGQNYGNLTSGNLTSLGNNLGNVAMQGNQYIGTTGLQGAVQAGNAYMGAGNATAAGIMGQGNAYTSAINGLGSAVGGYFGQQQQGGGGSSLSSLEKLPLVGSGATYGNLSSALNPLNPFYGMSIPPG